jgi:glycosyltransferase involved in cell wall biosynthesis
VSHHILHVSQPTDAGVARCVADFAAAQQASGLAVTVACPADGPLAAELSALGIQVREWAATRSPGPGVAAEGRALGRLVAGVGPDLVHLHSAKAGLSGRLALRGRVPTVFQPHAWSFDAVDGPLAVAALRWERAAAAHWTHALVCVSQAERERGEQRRIRAPYRVMPNGVDLQQLTVATPEDRAAARRRLGYDDEPLAACVGRLSRQKGQDVLLEAWPTVLSAVPDARLVLVGDGPDAAVLAARGAPAVELVGRRDDVPDWLAAADVVVVPSRWEGMALVPLEALARGRSVVASDVTGVRECVPAGCGAVVPPDDARELATAVAARLADRRLADREGAAGRTHVERAHDLAVTTTRLAQVYADVIAGVRSHHSFRTGGGARENG